MSNLGDLADRLDYLSTREQAALEQAAREGARAIRAVAAWRNAQELLRVDGYTDETRAAIDLAHTALREVGRPLPRRQARRVPRAR